MSIDMPLGMHGCKNDTLAGCKSCKYENATEQCSRLYRIMEKYGKTPFGQPYP